MSGSNSSKRVSVNCTNETCTWCGNKGKVRKNGTHTLFVWQTITPMLRVIGTSKLFCSVSCRRSYEG